VVTTAAQTTTTTAQIPLSAIATIEQITAPLVVTHQAQFPAATLSFNLAPGASLGQAVAAVARAEQQIGLPDTISGNYSGDAAEFQKSLASEPWLILASIVVIYIVLGVLYESIIHPVTILSTLPSAAVGALLALILSNTEFSMIALIGVILLIGIVKKNAIMMIDFALQAEYNEKLSPRSNVPVRALLAQGLWAIMMTPMAALIGALPLMLASGSGSELRRPLGLVIVGGLVFSQVLTLFTTPVIYLMFDRLARRWKRYWQTRRLDAAA